MSSEHVSDIIIGLVGGASAGVGIWVIDSIKRAYLFCRDEKRILKFFEDDKKYNETFRTTHRIASAVDFTMERVNHVCSYSRKIDRNELENESWRLRKVRS